MNNGVRKFLPAVLLFLLMGCAGRATNDRFLLLDGEIMEETVSGQMWQVERSPRLNSFQEATAYVEQLDLGGYDDWRLPTIYELYDLNFLFDIHKNGDITLNREGNYWSGEKDGDGMIGAWAISDQCDPERQYEPGRVGYVRAVRP